MQIILRGKAWKNVMHASGNKGEAKAELELIFNEKN